MADVRLIELFREGNMTSNAALIALALLLLVLCLTIAAVLGACGVAGC